MSLIDEQLEAKITIAKQILSCGSNPFQKQAAQEELTRLVALRSPERVREMEVAFG